MHTLVTYIAEPNGDPWRIGTWPNSDLVGCQRDGRRWAHAWEGNLVFYLNSLFATLWESGIFFSHFATLFFFLENNPISLLLIWFSYFGVSWWEDLVWDDWVCGGDFECMTAGEKMSGGGCQSRNRWLTNQILEASKWWEYEGNRSADDKFHFLDGHTVRQSSW